MLGALKVPPVPKESRVPLVVRGHKVGKVSKVPLVPKVEVVTQVP